MNGRRCRSMLDVDEARRSLLQIEPRVIGTGVNCDHWTDAGVYAKFWPLLWGCSGVAVIGEGAAVAEAATWADSGTGLEGA